jgi:hypothetical protein
MSNEEYLDLDNPIHAKAFLLAASHFLSSWPQEWTAQELETYLFADEDSPEDHLENQHKIRVWSPIENWCADEGDLTGSGKVALHSIIENLAEDIINFHQP